MIRLNLAEPVQHCGLSPEGRKIKNNEYPGVLSRALFMTNKRI